MRRGVSHERVSRDTVGGARRPVLIVRVGAAENDSTGEPARRCDVRLVHAARSATTDQPWSSREDEITAVVILRDATPSRVVSCVRAATRGGGSIPPELLRKLLPPGEDRHRDTSEPQLSDLSDREYDVLQMLADGDTTRSIAERLSYSERTVKNIVHDLLVKLNCKTRAHAVALAARQGVI